MNNNFDLQAAVYFTKTSQKLCPVTNNTSAVRKMSPSAADKGDINEYRDRKNQSGN